MEEAPSETRRAEWSITKGKEERKEKVALRSYSQAWVYSEPGHLCFEWTRAL